MNDAALVVDELDVSFGGIHALRGVSLSVPLGAIYGIVGPNGSGKTTVLNAVSGFVRSSGGIHVLGHSVSRWPSHRRFGLGMARTFQVPKISHTLTVWELMRMGDHGRRDRAWWKETLAPWAAAREERETRRRAGDTLESLGLDTGLLDTRVQTLAQGIIKMLDVARALMAAPTLLLLDEPTAGMNEAEIANLAQRLQALNAAGLTIAVVEHNIRFLAGACHIVAVLHVGRKICDGRPEEVLIRPDVIEAYLGDVDTGFAGPSHAPEDQGRPAS